MMDYLLWFALAAVGLYLIWTFARHITDLKNLDVNSIGQARQGLTKAMILEKKLARRSAAIKDHFAKIFIPRTRFLSDKIKTLKNRMAVLEDKYNGSKAPVTPVLIVAELIQEARKMIATGDLAAAEKIMIEVLAKDRKNLDAYEILGEVYTLDKKYNQAEEVYKYLLRLVAVKNSEYKKLNTINLKNDQLEEAEIGFLSALNVSGKIAVYYHDLGRVYELTARNDKAIDCFLKATSIEPNNPKYLDKLIELSIQTGDRGLAKRIFNHLKKINPENGKLEIWRESIEKLK